MSTPQTALLKSLELKLGVPAIADQNVFDWYDEVFPVGLEGIHVIDWGAGVGRFLDFFARRKPDAVTLVEPDPQAFGHLSYKASGRKDVGIIRGGLGANVGRVKSPEQTLHTCNFVLTSFGTPIEGLAALGAGVRPGERVYLFTNVFAPKNLAAQIRTPNARDRLPIRIERLAEVGLQRPMPSQFLNRKSGTTMAFTDAVHLLSDFKVLGWEIQASDLMKPDGFEHEVRAGEDFGDYAFLVLACVIKRKGGHP